MALARNMLLLSALTASGFAQSAADRFVGTLQGVRPETLELQMRTDNADERTVKILPDTVFQRIAPGEQSLKNAQTIRATDLVIGDRAFVTLEPGTSDLRRLIVMSASDLAKRDEADRQDWQKRGVSGIVTSRNGDVLTLRATSFMAESQTPVKISGKTVFRRYAPDSVKFSDAKISSAAEIAIGDQVRARGNKSSDGVVQAEEVVFGSFLTKAGKIESVDAAERTVTIAEMGTNQRLVVRFTNDSKIKKMPSMPAMGAMPGGAPGAGGFRSGGPPDLSQMLEQMPPATFEDLQPGETIVLSSTKGTAGRLTAIMLILKADMLIRMATMQRGPNRGDGPQMPMGNGAGLSMGGAGLEGLQLPGMVP